VQRAIGGLEDVFVAGELDQLPFYRMREHLGPNAYNPECVYCSRKKKPCPIWHEKAYEDLENIGLSSKIYFLLSNLSDRNIIVDSSKTPYWFHCISNAQGFSVDAFELISIHCYRNPFAYADSLRRRTGKTLPECVFDWLLVNRDALNVIQTTKHFSPVISVYHDEFLKCEERFLDVLANICGVTESDVTQRYRNRHFLGGNPSAYPFHVDLDDVNHGFREMLSLVLEGQVIERDDRWASRIQKPMRRRLADISGVRDLCYTLGIDIDSLIEY